MFQTSEFACKCCGVIKLDPKLLDVMNCIRSKVGEPVYITSGYRCPNHNREVGGEPNSQHLYGTAADFYCEGTNTTELAKVAEECGADGIGLYDSWVHADVRGEYARW